VQREVQRERQAREQAAREQREREARQNRDSTRGSAPQPRSGNPYPGYTGPRCYDPGGVTWKPC
jgi:micrococcal nuclease